MRDNLIGYYWYSWILAKLDQETFCILFSDETIALVLFFFYLNLKSKPTCLTLKKKIIFEGFFDSRLKMKLPTQKKISNGKGRPKIYSEDKIEASSFLRARGLSLKAFQRWLNFFGSSFKSRFLCLCDYDAQQWRHQRSAMLRIQQLLANRRLANFWLHFCFFYSVECVQREDGIRTTDLWCLKWPLYHLSPVLGH